MTTPYNPHEAASERRARRARLWADRGIVDPWLGSPATTPTAIPMAAKIPVDNSMPKRAGIAPETAGSTSMASILRAVSSFYGFKPRDLLTQCKVGDVVQPRLLAIYLMRRISRHSWSQIARFMRRSTCTIHYADDKISLLAKTDTRLAEDIKLLTAWLTTK